MDSIAIIDNFFDDEWLKKVKLFIEIQSRAPVWTNNRILFPELTNGSGIIFINFIPGPFDLELQDYMISKGILKKRCTYFSGLLYRGESESYIDWHNDGTAPFSILPRCAISIYLNEEWNSSWGGWFSFQEENSKFLQSYSPSFNSAVVLLKDVRHCTTPISSSAKSSRISFQLFFDMESLNVEYFK